MTPLVVMAALSKAGTVVCEPIHRFRLDIPQYSLTAILSLLARLSAVPGAPRPSGSSFALEGEIPAAHVHELQQALPGLTRGEGVLEAEFERYEPVRGAQPTRPRSDLNPLNREEYLLPVKRRVIRREIPMSPTAPIAATKAPNRRS